LLIVGGAYTLWLGSSPVEAFLVAMRLHLDMRRSYLPNLGLHAWDFAIYTGLAATTLALACMAGLRVPRVSRLSLAFGLTMLILLLSGSAQGEVGRVWIFFMPVVLLLAAACMQQLSPRQRRILLAAQVFWLLALAASHRPVDTWLGPPPAYAAVVQPALPEAVTPISARFSDDLRLTGFQSHYDPARRIVTLALHWQALREIAVPYYFSIVPVAPDGHALPGIHWQPFGKLYPTTCWPPGGSGSEIVDHVELPLGDAAVSGDWWLSLSTFAMQGDQRLAPLPVGLPDGKQDNQVGLGPVTVQTQP
jgi:hypothetical protein